MAFQFCTKNNKVPSEIFENAPFFGRYCRYNSGKNISAIDTIAASLFPLSDDLLPAISNFQWALHGYEEATFLQFK
jgi:hypothetical protein